MSQIVEHTEIDEHLGRTAQNLIVKHLFYTTCISIATNNRTPGIFFHCVNSQTRLTIRDTRVVFIPVSVLWTLPVAGWPPVCVPSPWPRFPWQPGPWLCGRSWLWEETTNWPAGGRFKNAHELLNVRALKISMFYKNHTFLCMGKIFCVEFQRYPLKFHTIYLIHTLKDVYFIHRWKFKSA